MLKNLTTIILTKCLRRFLKNTNEFWISEVSILICLVIMYIKLLMIFFNTLAFNSILPYILQPTRLTSYSKILIDNIFFNTLSSEMISGNLTYTTSDHLPQFLFAPNILSNPSYNKSNIYERDGSKFDKENFILDHFDKSWSDIYFKLTNKMWISI